MKIMFDDKVFTSKILRTRQKIHKKESKGILEELWEKDGKRG